MSQPYSKEEDAAQPSQARLDLIESLTPIVLKALSDAVFSLTEDHSSSADYTGISIGGRLENKLETNIRSAIHMHGLRKSMSDGPRTGMYVPYMDYLEEVAPGLAEMIESGKVDLLDIANCDALGTRRLPGYLVEDILCDDNGGNLHIAYNRMLPYSAKVLNASYWGKNPKCIKGDQSRGMLLGDFWKALCPPFGANQGENGSRGQAHARFNLATSILTLRKAGSAPFVQSLDDTFYCEHPNNTLGVDTQRFSFCGPAFMGLKHVAEIWNGLVHTVHGNPVEHSTEHTNLQPLLYTAKDVGATLCALSLAFIHDKDSTNAKQAAMFFSGRDCPINGSENSKLLKRPVCHIKTQNDKDVYTQMMAEFTECPWESVQQNKEHQRTRQAEADSLSVYCGESTVWGHAKDQYVKHKFEKNRFGNKGAKGKGEIQRRRDYANGAKSNDWRVA